MRTVFTFWQTAEDENEFFEYLATTGDILVFPSGKQLEREALVGIPLSLFCNNSDQSEVLFTLSKLSDQVVIETLQASHGYAISPMSSPVLAYDSGRLTRNSLVPANAYAYWKKLEGKTLKSQPAEFIKWAKSVFRWLRHHAHERSKEKDLPMTFRAKSLHEKGIDLQKY